MRFSSLEVSAQSLIGLILIFNMDYKKLNLPDSKNVRKLLDSVWEETYIGCLTPEAVSALSKNWGGLKELSSEEEQNIVVVAAFDEKDIAGIAIALKTVDEKAEIKHLYVLPSYQGQGVGRRLLTEILVSFTEVKTVDLWVETENHPAISFYEKFSFEKKEIAEVEKNGVVIRLVKMEISLEIPELGLAEELN